MSRKGFTLVELMLALTLSLLALSVFGYIATIAVNRPVASAEFITARSGIEETAAEVSSLSLRAEHSFAIDGLVTLAGQPWLGGQVVNAPPLSDESSVESLLLANGLAAAPSTGASSLVMVSPSGWATILLIERQGMPQGILYRVTLHRARGTKIVEYLAPGASLAHPDQPTPGVTRNGDVLAVLLPNPSRSDPLCTNRAVPIAVTVPVSGR